MKPILIKKTHIGLLHKNLNIPKGQKIPHSTLISALGKTTNPVVKKRIQFALNAAQFGKR